jgi:tRNA 2-thiouridine synthesizing protein C
MNNCKLLFIFRHSPYGSNLAREGLEAALAAGAFDQDVAILFMDEGVWQLHKNQQAQQINRKNHQKMTSALPMFGIGTLLVHQPSLSVRKLTADDLYLQVKLLDERETQSLLSNAKIILSF